MSNGGVPQKAANGGGQPFRICRKRPTSSADSLTPLTMPSAASSRSSSSGHCEPAMAGIVYAISGSPPAAPCTARAKAASSLGADAVVVRRDQHHARRAGGHRVCRQRHGVALCGRADLDQHRRARAGRDHGLEQRPALDRGVQVELARRAGEHQTVQPGVDETAPERRRGATSISSAAS